MPTQLVRAKKREMGQIGRTVDQEQWDVERFASTNFAKNLVELSLRTNGEDVPKKLYQDPHVEIFIAKKTRRTGIYRNVAYQEGDIVIKIKGQKGIMRITRGGIGTDKSWRLGNLTNHFGDILQGPRGNKIKNTIGDWVTRSGATRHDVASDYEQDHRPKELKQKEEFESDNERLMRDVRAGSPSPEYRSSSETPPPLPPRNGTPEAIRKARRKLPSDLSIKKSPKRGSAKRERGEVVVGDAMLKGKEFEIGKDYRDLPSVRKEVAALNQQGPKPPIYEAPSSYRAPSPLYQTLEEVRKENKNLQKEMLIEIFQNGKALFDQLPKAGSQESRDLTLRVGEITRNLGQKSPTQNIIRNILHALLRDMNIDDRSRLGIAKTSFFRAIEDVAHSYGINLDEVEIRGGDKSLGEILVEFKVLLLVSQVREPSVKKDVPIVNRKIQSDETSNPTKSINDDQRNHLTEKNATKAPENLSNPKSTTPYRGIGVKARIKELNSRMSLVIEGVYSPEINRFFSGDTLLKGESLKGCKIVKIKVGGKILKVSDLFKEEGGLEKISTAFHSEGKVEFEISKEIDGVRRVYPVYCDNSRDLSSTYAPVESSFKATKDVLGDVDRTPKEAPKSRVINPDVRRLVRSDLYIHETMV